MTKIEKQIKRKREREKLIQNDRKDENDSEQERKRITNKQTKKERERQRKAERVSQRMTDWQRENIIVNVKGDEQT